MNLRGSMAKTVYEILVSLQGTKQVQDNLVGLTQDLTLVGSQLKQTGDQIGAILNSANTAFKEYESALARVNTILRQGDEGLNKFDEALRGNVASTGNIISLVDAANASYEAFSSGITDVKDNLELLTKAQDLALGGFTTLTQGVNTLTNVYNAYSGKVEDAATSTEAFSKIADQAAKVQELGKITIDEYSKYIGRVAPAGSAAGVGISELNAAIAQATSKGLSAESTFSGLSGLLKAIQQPTLEATREVASLNIELQSLGEAPIAFDSVALKTKGLLGVLEDVNRALTLTGKQGALGSLIGDVEAFRVAVSLLGDNFSQYSSFVDQVRDSTGSASNAADKMAQTFESKTLVAFNKVNQGLIELGKGVAVALTPLLDGLGFLIDNFNQLPEPIKNLVTYATVATGGLLTLSGTFLIVVGSAKALWGALLEVSLWQKNLSASITQANAGLASQAIAANNTTSAMTLYSGATAQASNANKGMIATASSLGSGLLSLLGTLGLVAGAYYGVTEAIRVFQANSGKDFEVIKAFEELNAKLRETVKLTQEARGELNRTGKVDTSQLLNPENRPEQKNFGLDVKGYEPNFIDAEKKLGLRNGLSKGNLRDNAPELLGALRGNLEANGYITLGGKKYSKKDLENDPYVSYYLGLNSSKPLSTSNLEGLNTLNTTLDQGAKLKQGVDQGNSDLFATFDTLKSKSKGGQLTEDQQVDFKAISKAYESQTALILKAQEKLISDIEKTWSDPRLTEGQKEAGAKQLEEQKKALDTSLIELKGKVLELQKATGQVVSEQLTSQSKVILEEQNRLVLQAYESLSSEQTANLDIQKSQLDKSLTNQEISYKDYSRKVLEIDKAKTEVLIGNLNRAIESGKLSESGRLEARKQIISLENQLLENQAKTEQSILENKQAKLEATYRQGVAEVKKYILERSGDEVRAIELETSLNRKFNQDKINLLKDRLSREKLGETERLDLITQISELELTNLQNSERAKEAIRAEFDKRRQAKAGEYSAIVEKDLLNQLITEKQAIEYSVKLNDYLLSEKRKSLESQLNSELEANRDNSTKVTQIKRDLAQTELDIENNKLDGKKKLLDQELNISIANSGKQLNTLKGLYNSQTISETDYLKEAQKIQEDQLKEEQRVIEEKIKLSAKGSQERAKLEEQLTQNILRQQELTIDSQKANLDRVLKIEQSNGNKRLAELERLKNDRLISETDYYNEVSKVNQEILRDEQRAIEEKIKLSAKGSQERADLERQLAENLLNQQQESIEAVSEAIGRQVEELDRQVSDTLSKYDNLSRSIGVNSLSLSGVDSFVSSVSGVFSDISQGQGDITSKTNELTQSFSNLEQVTKKWAQVLNDPKRTLEQEAQVNLELNKARNEALNQQRELNDLKTRENQLFSVANQAVNSINSKYGDILVNVSSYEDIQSNIARLEQLRLDISSKQLNIEKQQVLVEIAKERASTLAEIAKIEAQLADPKLSQGEINALRNQRDALKEVLNLLEQEKQVRLENIKLQQEAIDLQKKTSQAQSGETINPNLPEPPKSPESNPSTDLSTSLEGFTGEFKDSIGVLSETLTGQSEIISDGLSDLRGDFSGLTQSNSEGLGKVNEALLTINEGVLTGLVPIPENLLGVKDSVTSGFNVSLPSALSKEITPLNDKLTQVGTKIDSGLSTFGANLQAGLTRVDTGISSIGVTLTALNRSIALLPSAIASAIPRSVVTKPSQ